MLFGFLAYQLPCHVSVTAYEVLVWDEELCPTWNSLLAIAKATNQLIALLPPELVLSLEKEELAWENKSNFPMFSF